MNNRAPETWGNIQVYTGNGKGKTTAALGTALRALAAGKQVAILYFDKGGSHYSERAFLTWLATQQYPSGGGIAFAASGLDRIDPLTGRFRFGVIDEDRAEAERGFAVAAQWIAAGKHDLVVLDEINTTVDLGMLPLEPLLAALDGKPANMEIICTGRNAPQLLRERASLVTDMTLVKHYFYQGAAAREGLDY